MPGRHPSSPFACLKECRSPLACATFGYCRELNFVPTTRPICTGCLKRPDEIAEYIDFAKPWGGTPDAYVRAEEGTYNEANGHFLCTDCYQRAGEPTKPGGWIAP